MAEEYAEQRILSGNLDAVVVQLNGGIRALCIYPISVIIHKALAPNVRSTANRSAAQTPEGPELHWNNAATRTTSA
jgi:hypothetical protein